MKITYVIRNVYGIGGTIKTTIDSANALADRGHEVSVVSLMRHRADPQFPVRPSVKVSALLDVRPPRKGGEVLRGKNKKLSQLKSKALCDGVDAMNMKENSALLDQRLERYLGRHDADVVVGTHAGINLVLAQMEERRQAVVGQEHMYYEQYRKPVQAAMRRVYPALDALVVLTELDAEDYRRALPAVADRMEAIPNSIPRNEHPREEADPPHIMAAGRLAPMKRYDVAIRAFAHVADRFPEWRLRIYGKGKQRDELEALAAELGVGGRVEFMGAVSPLDVEWAKATVALSSAWKEPFGLTLVEAMAAGTPLVSTEVKYGPMSFIEDGYNGLLAPPQDPEALGNALARVMEDETLRKHLSENGRAVAASFEPDKVVAQHEDLFRRVAEANPPKPRPGLVARLFGR
ncbi:glycosyltransferase family 4 protein [Salininema proteolyticum]|uniref:Glycosyltransferase family 4 protein n=1 Tax=Salininema proteolyticum TaxID=1607685 RepID=A0ABV8U287_9ACTN